MHSPRAQKVRVIRLSEAPPRATGGRAQGPEGPSTLDAASQPWPQPIGSRLPGQAAGGAHEAQASAPRATLRAVPPAEAPGEPAVRRLPRGAVKAWPVKVSHDANRHARRWAWLAAKQLLSAGAYLPWAATEAGRSLWRHTRVAGLSLDDHRRPLAWLTQAALTWALLLGVGLSWLAGSALGLVATSLAVLAWPMLVFMQVRQRAQHLSWARRRMGFEGRCAQVYGQVWPLMLGAWTLLWGGAAAAHWGSPQAWCLWGAVAAGAAMVAPLGGWAWLNWRQRQLRLGPWSVWWAGPREGLWSLFWRAVVWSALVAAFMGGVTALLWAALRLCHVPVGAWGHGLWVALPAGLVGVAARAYVQARLQNFVWGKTGNKLVRLQSRLNVAAYVRQQCRHALLLVLTCGLYWPWAQAATHRARLQAITVWSRVDADELRARWPSPGVAP
ncbi:MAG: hypothetical protein RI907_2443 [Pseudomonadota bacterium]